ncbi:CPBP family intramembrane glutamic endopeptidase [Cyclobacterium jeungdonense]|uniref:Type II CAAX endopeptidase family protein n=1 Tax=Cyclobacterium jeungdonense TaxID=708087 RepID=A0ABT8C6E4_9BACT|nr:type II CAAX endopeptidase family protein [Cyclobacterium jeungdonense]MDN3687256.1 type II CAAX endopeptidase family protein [Cyclobacterium jeungdonense]
MESPKNRVVGFVLITTFLTLILFFSKIQFPSVSLFSILLMWTPALAAFIMSVLGNRPLKEIGWKVEFKWIGIAWCLPVIYALFAYGLLWAVGSISFPNPTFLERAQLTMGIEMQSTWKLIVLAFFFITIVNLVPASVFALGEEIGWRGFMVPEMLKWMGFFKTAFFSGLLWSFWHLPGILSGEYGESSTSLAFRLVCFFLLVLSGSLMLTWLRVGSSSIWPAAIFHATHNGVIQTFFERLHLPTESSVYWTGEFGLGLALTATLLAAGVAILVLGKKGQGRRVSTTDYT